MNNKFKALRVRKYIHDGDHKKSLFEHSVSDVSQDEINYSMLIENQIDYINTAPNRDKLYLSEDEQKTFEGNVEGLIREDISLSTLGDIGSRGTLSGLTGDGNQMKLHPRDILGLLRRNQPKFGTSNIAGVTPIPTSSSPIYAMRAYHDNDGKVTEALYSEEMFSAGIGKVKAEATYNVAFAASNITLNPGDFVRYTTSDGKVYILTVKAGTTQALANGTKYRFSSLDKSGESSGTDMSNMVFASGAAGDMGAGIGLPYEGVTRGELENLGLQTNTDFDRIKIGVSRVIAQAKGYGVRSNPSNEMAQDFKASHGADLYYELTKTMVDVIAAQTSRTIVRTVVASASVGASTDFGVGTAGKFDLSSDGNGRWSKERAIGLLAVMEYEANRIWEFTRFGKGNYSLVSPNVASALNIASMSYEGGSGIIKTSIDTTGQGEVGQLNNGMKIVVDPFASSEYACVGYKGKDAGQSGIIFSPYVPLELMTVIDPNTFAPTLGGKTRFALTANPYSYRDGDSNRSVPDNDANTGAIVKDKNGFARKFSVVL